MLYYVNVTIILILHYLILHYFNVRLFDITLVDAALAPLRHFVVTRLNVGEF